MATADESTADVDEEWVVTTPPRDGQKGQLAEPAAESAELFTLIRKEDYSAALKFLETRPQDWSARDGDGHSLLHWAALQGNTEFVRMALSNGIPVDVEASNGQVPLMWAMLGGHAATSRALLDARANLQHQDSEGATALTVTIQHQRRRLFLLLLNRGGKTLLEEKDNNGCSAVHWAAYKGDLQFLQLMEYFGVDLQATDNLKMLPLHRAVSSSQAPVIQFLVEKGNDPLQRNADGDNCLDIAEKRHDRYLHGALEQWVKYAESTGVKFIDPWVNLKLLALITADEDWDQQEGLRAVIRGLWKAATVGRNAIILHSHSLYKDRAGRKLFPMLWLVCVSLSLFEYITEIRTASWEVAPFASIFFEIGVPFSIALFAWVAFSDPGKVKPRLRGHSIVEDLMKACDSELPDSMLPDLGRLCPTTLVLKDPRAKYCSQTGEVIEEYDQYCVWLNNAIGKQNHRHFFCLALVEWWTQVCAIYIIWFVSFKLVEYQSFSEWLLNLCAGYPLLALVWALHSITAPLVLTLVMFQAHLIATNMTTNEMVNANRYDHFWEERVSQTGQKERIYCNPFCKGNAFNNCLDFWWFCERSTAGSRGWRCRDDGAPSFDFKEVI